MNTVIETRPQSVGDAARRQWPAPNIMFSHMGLTVSDVGPMEDFYVRVLGFTVTDRGAGEGMDLVFLSRDPRDHHQIVLASGKPDNIPGNTLNAQFGPSINQISFRVGSLPDLRDIHERLVAERAENLFPVNHGVAWSIYAHDPEGNNLEFFVDTEWYILQPLLLPLDLDKPDEEIITETKAMCEKSEGFQTIDEWRSKIAPRMTPYVARR